MGLQGLWSMNYQAASRTQLELWAIRQCQLMGSERGEVEQPTARLQSLVSSQN